MFTQKCPFTTRVLGQDLIETADTARNLIARAKELYRQAAQRPH